ncbi:MAG: flagellar M-ring protein FliF [Gammaproteobacteria bacterium]|nr:flagellar M-ring protein FliF [Gammaproteobacteria bacterium]
MAEQTLYGAPQWTGQLVRQAGILVGIAAAVALGVYVVLWSRAPAYTALFGDMADLDVADLVTGLEANGIAYRIEPGSGTVLVAAEQAADARLKLAAAGLPRSAVGGMDALYQDPGFGTSQFMEQARYQYAQEGELARTIKNLNNVRGARVHLAIPKQSAFVREQRPPSASVVLDLFSGRRLDPGQVEAIANLVAASVPNLRPGEVKIIDQRGNLLSDPAGDDELAFTAKQFEFVRQREEEYARRVRDILAPMVGYDGVQAQVNAVFDFTSSEEYSDRWDPQQQVVRSEQTMEENRGANAPGGVPGALSNEPPGVATAPEVATATGETSAALPQHNRRVEATRNYELGRTISHVRPATGNLRRLSVAVLVRNPKAVAPAGTTAGGAAPAAGFDAAQLERMQTLVKEAIGYDADRGDTVQVVNADFLEPAPVEELPGEPIWQQGWVLSLGKQLLGGGFVLFLVFGVLRPVFKNLMGRPATVTMAADSAALALPSGVAGQLPRQAGMALAAIPAPAPGADVGQIKGFVAQDPKVAAQVIKNWVGDE